MKSIIKQRVYKKQYYLVTYSFSYFGDRLDRFDQYLGANAISNFEQVYLRDETIETQKIHRELLKNDTIQHDGEKLTIKEVIYSTDGTIIYYVEEDKIIDDEKSMKQCEEELRLREIVNKSYKEGIERGRNLAEHEFKLRKEKNSLVKRIFSKESR